MRNGRAVTFRWLSRDYIQAGSKQDLHIFPVMAGPVWTTPTTPIVRAEFNSCRNSSSVGFTWCLVTIKSTFTPPQAARTQGTAPR
jgi:hypothetical protein